MEDLLCTVTQVIKELPFTIPYSPQEWLSRNMIIENQHKHTNWSNLTQIDSATDIRDFIRFSQEYGCQYYFSTEHGYPGEWLNAYNICKEMGIGFRYGVEVYWVKDINSEEKDRTNCHMVLIARNYNAIRKINYLITRAQDEGFYYKPRIDLKMLFELTPEDVYVCSACVAGWLYPDASEIWYQVWQHFKDSFFFEYQYHNTDRQKEINKRIKLLSDEFGINTIVGLDTHYLTDEDRIKRENLLARKKINYEDEVGWYMDFPNGKEVYKRFLDQGILTSADIVKAMLNTYVFVDGCTDFEYNRSFKIPVLPKYQMLSYQERCDKLYELLLDQYHKEPIQNQARLDGLNYEFGEIVESGTADYFLSNYEVVKLAIEKYGGQLTTTSRGSASSYYTSKLCGFTTMDRFEAEVPIYPERFITKDRILSSHQMPDIDLNISQQEPFVSAARELFGAQSCYPLLAVGKLGEKSGFKLYADIEGLEPSVANEISKMIDDYNEDKKNADDDSKDLIVIEDYITNNEYLRIFQESQPYQGIVEQAKVHACGHLIFNGDGCDTSVAGYGDIRYEFGLIRCRSESTGNSTLVVNGEGGLLDTCGYCKDDFLIVDVVSIIWKLYHALGREVPTVTELREMVKDDRATWDLYARGITCCLNQCEKAGTTQKVQIYQPRNIKELSAFIAGIRPGFKSLIDGFIRRQPYSSGEKAIDTLLADCFNYMLYQESVMKIFSYLGIPMKDSYDTIKKISKKKLKGEALKHVEDTLKEHWLNEIGNLDNFEEIYQVIKDSARYSFNAPHALAMCNDSLYEAWIKAHYPSVFYQTTMNHYQDKGNKDKVVELQREALTKMGYKKNRYKFGNDHRSITIDDQTKTIYPSLVSLKNMNTQVAEELYVLGQSHFDNFIDLLFALKKTSIDARQLDILIKLDFFSDFGDSGTLLKINDVFQSIAKTKMTQFRKADIEARGVDLQLVTRYALGETPTSYKYSPEMYRQLLIDFTKICDLHTPLEVKLRWQLELLGYVDYSDPNLDSRLILISDLDTKYSPRFKAICLKTGQSCEMRVASKGNPRDGKTTFNRVPFENGDILWMDKCVKKPKQRKTENGWEIAEGFNWWIDNYHKITM